MSQFEQIRRQLAHTDAILHGAETAVTPERTLEILQARARALARSVVKESQEKSVVLIVFRLGEQRYAIPLVQVVEIQPFEQYSPVPGVPPFIKGVMNVRGQIFTVVDLRVFFSVASGQASERGESILIVEDCGYRVGLLVDDVIGISRYQPSEIHHVRLNLSTIKAEYISETTSDSVAILNLSEILSDRKLMVEDE